MDARNYTWDDLPVPRPATGRTPNRNIRVVNEIWRPALAKARAEGRTLTDVIVAFLREYISTPPRKRDDNG